MLGLCRCGAREAEFAMRSCTQRIPMTRLARTLLDEETLSAEALLLSRYLLGRGPQEETVARYVTANRRLFAEPFEPRDAAVLDYCRRHPRALPLLDAGAGLVAGQSLLRKKILVMAAILETTTSCAPDFLPAPTPGPALAVQLLGLALAAGCKSLAGTALWLVASRSRR